MNNEDFTQGLDEHENDISTHRHRLSIVKQYNLNEDKNTPGNRIIQCTLDARKFMLIK